MTNVQTPTINVANDILTEIYSIPPRSVWTRSGAAKFLGCNRITVQVYAETVCTAVLDFRRAIPRDANKAFISGFALTQYQMWVLLKTINLARLIRAELNGREYYSTLRKFLAANQEYFSHDAFKHQQSFVA